jgi:hypothetical protein
MPKASRFVYVLRTADPKLTWSCHGRLEITREPLFV